MAAKKGTFRLSIGVNHRTWGLDEAKDAAKLLDAAFWGMGPVEHIRTSCSAQVCDPDVCEEPLPCASIVVTCTRRQLDAATEFAVEAIKPLVNETLSGVEDSDREGLIVVVIQEEVGCRLFTPHAYRSRTATAMPPGPAK